MLDTIAVQFLLWFSAFLGVSSQHGTSLHWETLSEWDLSQRYPSLQMSSTQIGTECARDPSKFVEFPLVVHGAHRVWRDGKLILSAGNESFENQNYFYAVPAISCKELMGAQRVEWKVTSYSKYFARVASAPMLTKRPLGALIGTGVGIVTSGMLFALSVVLILAFWNMIDRKLVISGAACGFLVTLFYVCANSAWFFPWFDMITSHKIADICVFIGMYFLIRFFRYANVLSQNLQYLFGVSVCLGTLIILFAESGDGVQFGTMLPLTLLPFVLLFGMVSFFAQQRHLSATQNEKALAFGLAIVFAFAGNDFLVIFGLIDSYPSSTLATLGWQFSAVWSMILTTRALYRSQLNFNAELGQQVTARTQELRGTILNLQKAQAELVQNSKLVALGTLSAGISHEINNSLNCVYGSVQPLERYVAKQEDTPDRNKANKLLKLMNEGLVLTFDIIKSLKLYTGSASAPIDDFNLAETIDSVGRILKSRIEHKATYITRLDRSIVLRGNSAVLSQILMNLICNALDAIPDKGVIEVTASLSDDDKVCLSIRDEGTGMPEAVIAKIFDPFFTTKNVGEGTGLGMHIVHTEVTRMGGTIKIDSVAGKGTEICVLLPRSGTQAQV